MSHSGTKIIQARKFMRASTAPPRMMTVMAAKTNWKKTMVDIGNAAVMAADGMTAYNMKSETETQASRSKIALAAIHLEQQQVRMLTCFNSV